MRSSRCRRSLVQEMVEPPSSSPVKSSAAPPRPALKRKGSELDRLGLKRLCVSPRKVESSPKKSQNVKTGSFYGSKTSRYLSPLERANQRKVDLTLVKPVVTPVLKSPVSVISKKSPKNIPKSAKKSKVKKVLPKLRVSERRKTALKFVEKVAPPEIAEKAESNESNQKDIETENVAPEKKRFFKHRLNSPSKRARNTGPGVLIKKGFDLKFQPKKRNKANALQKKEPESNKRALKSASTPLVGYGRSPRTRVRVHPRVLEVAADSDLSDLSPSASQDLFSSSGTGTVKTSSPGSVKTSSFLASVRDSVRDSPSDEDSVVSTAASSGERVDKMDTLPVKNSSSAALVRVSATNEGSVAAGDSSQLTGSRADEAEMHLKLDSCSTCSSSQASTGSVLLLSSDAASVTSTAASSVARSTPVKKFFSIFTKGSPRSSLESSVPSSPAGGSSGSAPATPQSGVSGRSARHLLRRLRDKNGLEQMTLDYGQKNIGGVVQCADCGMTYHQREPSDEALHAKFHHRLLATLKFPGWKKERIVQQNSDGSRVIVATPDDKYATKKIDAVRQMVDEELGFVVERRPLRANSKTYLYVSERRIIGCCIADCITKGYRVVVGEARSDVEEEAEARPWCCSTDPEPARCGISRIWTAPQERSQGVATLLLDCVRMNFIMGLDMTKEELAFSDPTPAGFQFATKYTGSPHFLVYKHNALQSP